MVKDTPWRKVDLDATDGRWGVWLNRWRWRSSTRFFRTSSSIWSRMGPSPSIPVGRSSARGGIAMPSGRRIRLRPTCGGHKRVVLAIIAKLTGVEQSWVLPVVVALYRNDKDNQAAGRRHKTPSDLMRQLLCVLLRWSPTRRCLRETVATPITCGLPHCPNATGKKTGADLDRQTTVTFSGAITLVCRDLWCRRNLATPAFKRITQKSCPQTKPRPSTLTPWWQVEINRFANSGIWASELSPCDDDPPNPA